MSDVTVRRATESDIPGIREVARVTWEATYTGHIPDEDIAQFVEHNYSERSVRRTIERLGSGYIVAEAGGDIIGYAVVAPNSEGEAELFAIYVLPGFHGQGVGKLLWAAAVSSARKTGYPTISLWVLRSNRAARRFYERQGATTGERRQYEVGDGFITEVRYTLVID